MQQQLILLRGAQGSGKTTFGQLLCSLLPSAHCFSADDYFVDLKGQYVFDANKLPEAHKQCLSNAHYAILLGTEVVIVANTFSVEWEMKPYFDLAAANDCKISCLIVENRHGGTNVHGCPLDVVERTKRKIMANIQL